MDRWNDEDVLTLKDVAKYLRISYMTAFRLTKNTQIKFFRIGTCWRIVMKDLKKLFSYQ